MNSARRRVSWGAIFAGRLIALVVQLLLSLLGLGIGMSTINPMSESGNPASGLGMGAGIWWVISSLISLYTGGWVAGRLAGIPRPADSVLHGLLTCATSPTVSKSPKNGSFEREFSATRLLIDMPAMLPAEVGPR